jgi:hypothetical protein
MFYVDKFCFVGEQEDKKGPVWKLAPVRGEDLRKGYRRVNMVEYYVLTKNETC